MLFPCLFPLPPDIAGLTEITEPPKDRAYLAQNSAGLWQLELPEQKPVLIDFADSYYRARGGTEYLPKAFKNLAGKQILDATAGWGRDSWLLAYRGFELTLLERHPALITLLKQGIAQAQNNPLTAQTASRIRAEQSESAGYIAAHGREFDAIYLDPMYPQREKSAKVKKDMQTLHILLAETENNGSALLTAALASGCPRVVVKRPKTAPYLADTAPHHSLQAPNTRFDIYLPA